MPAIWRSDDLDVRMSWGASAVEVDSLTDKVFETVSAIRALGGPFQSSWMMIGADRDDIRSLELTSENRDDVRRSVLDAVERNLDGTPFPSAGYDILLRSRERDGVSALLSAHVGDVTSERAVNSILLTINGVPEAADTNLESSLGSGARCLIDALRTIWPIERAMIGVSAPHWKQGKLYQQLGLLSYFRDTRFRESLRLPATVEVEDDPSGEGSWVTVRPGSDELDVVRAAVVEAARALQLV